MGNQINVRSHFVQIGKFGVKFSDFSKQIHGIRKIHVGTKT